jgi:hypothetical protein
VFLLPAVPPLIVVFVLAAALQWVAWAAEAWTTLRLTRARSTRLLFGSAESRVAVLCCGLLAAGAALLALGVALGQGALGVAGVAVMALVTPVQEAAHTGSARGRAVLYGWAVLLGLAIATSVILASPTLALAGLYAGWGTVWVAGGVRRALRLVP